MITLDNFTDTQKLIFADAFETMTCGNLTLDRQYTTEEEKYFDSEGRLSERRFVYPNNKYIKFSILFFPSTPMKKSVLCSLPLKKGYCN